MLAQLREAVRDSLPSKLVHAYRVIRHTMLYPSEWEMVTARRFLSPDKTAVDVGANTGLFTSVLARGSKKVIAFEPNPICARHLARVLPRNCELIAKAASDREGVTTLRVPVTAKVAMSALGTIEPANRFQSETRASDFISHGVETVTLDRILLAPDRTDDSVGFINVDAEGHDFAVLMGGQSVIAAQRPVILIELEYRHGAAVAEVFAWLQSRDYLPRALVDGRNLEPIDPDGLAALQTDDRLARRLSGSRHSGYINNVFFLPEI